MKEITEKEARIMFHTLGYDYEPRWNDTRGGYRNWFATTGNEEDSDFQAIKSLVEKGYMEESGKLEWGNEKVFSVTKIGQDYVVDLWLKKKKENKPSRSKRRYQAYFDWEDCYSQGTFKDFLMWLKIDKEDEMIWPEKYYEVREFKKRWNI